MAISLSWASPSFVIIGCRLKKTENCFLRTNNIRAEKEWEHASKPKLKLILLSIKCSNLELGDGKCKMIGFLIEI
jgi:hypothetical protein